jgi:hypothetical protein
MTDYTTLAHAFELAGHIVGIFALMQRCKGEAGIASEAPQRIALTGMANQPF